jgi:cystathionine beta-lyase
MRDATRCVHHPSVPLDSYASLAVPTFRASTIVYPDSASFANRARRGFDGYTYGLAGTPTTRTLEMQIANLYGGARTMLVPSGQAAITLTMLTYLRPGLRVLIPAHVYPPVRRFCSEYLALRGIFWSEYDPSAGAAIADLIDAQTGLVWVESPGSGTMGVQDVPAIAAAAKAKGVLVACDNTWATALLFKPLTHGVDIVCEALTKYVGGHSDVLMGAITVPNVAQRDEIKHTTQTLGIGVSPDEASLVLRGFETLGVRLAHVGRVSEDFARRLQTASAVARVLHPALPSCPGHEIWRRDFAGSSGVFSIVLKECMQQHVDAALGRLRIFALGASWGGTRSLIAPLPASADGSSSMILRISIGLEDEADLWEDLEALLAELSAQQQLTHLPTDCKGAAR